MIFLLYLTTLFSSPTPVEPFEEDLDQAKVEQACVNWADSTFSMHESYKFTYFKAFYTDEFTIQEMRIDLYKEKIQALDSQKNNGTFKGTEAEYEEARQSMVSAYEKALASFNPENRADHYITHFWTNIQTNDGITVYYELIVKLDNDYNVIEAVENSSIGKKEGASKIAYKKNEKLTKVIEKG